MVIVIVKSALRLIVVARGIVAAYTESHSMSIMV